MKLLAGLLLVLPGSGCASRKLLRLESQLVEQENQGLRASLLACEQQAGPPDFATRVDTQLLQAYLARAGFDRPTVTDSGALVVPYQGANTSFKITIQHFEAEKVLFLAANDYIRLEDAASSRSMVLLLTQLAALNFDLLLGKFQLDPASGEITLSVELRLDDGLGFRTFESALRQLLITADERYPALMRAAEGQGI